MPRPIDQSKRVFSRQSGSAIVEFTLRWRGSVPRINREAFRALQQDLVRACHVQASAAKDRRREFYERLEQLMKPWLSPS